MSTIRATLLDRSGLVGELGRLVARSSGPLDIAVVLAGQIAGVGARLGSEVSDAVLAEIAGRLLAGSGDGVVVARTGPDTFAVVRETGRLDLAAWGEHLVGLLDVPITASRLTLSLSCQLAVGEVALDGWDVDEAAELLQQLEDAVALARMSDPERVVWLPTVHRRRSDDAHALAERLRGALDRGEIVARYQPIVDLATDRIVGAEALARWDHGGPELERPEQFLGVAKTLGLMPAITERILGQACRDFAGGVPAAEGWWVSVNLDESESLHPETAGRIQSTLAGSGLAADRLIIEVSERIVPDPVAVRSLRCIADLGVRLAIDDFGCGWSSLAQIRSLPLALVKLDRSIVAVETHGDAGILMATVALAASLGLEVLAEGIELGEDLLLASLAGVALGQGFLWGPASTIDELAAMGGGTIRRGPAPTPGDAIHEDAGAPHRLEA